MNNWYFYILRCADGSLYVGVTQNLSQRLGRHNKGQGAAWVKQHGAAQVVYSEAYNDYLLARRREAQVKRWSRAKKESLVIGMKP
ncbi:GIY-YIG nuclease family protein [Patescibacteria group bacterium]|nr:GIY-YIG nuclease family protein [Patescibacteria group bacterium]